MRRGGGHLEGDGWSMRVGEGCGWVGSRWGVWGVARGSSQARGGRYLRLLGGGLGAELGGGCAAAFVCVFVFAVCRVLALLDSLCCMHRGEVGHGLSRAMVPKIDRRPSASIDSFPQSAGASAHGTKAAELRHVSAAVSSTRAAVGGHRQSEGRCPERHVDGEPERMRRACLRISLPGRVEEWRGSSSNEAA
jgi:hypothetical protein